MNAMRLKIQDALSAATVYVEMFKQQEEEKKRSANPTKSDDSPKSDVSSKKEESRSGLSLRTEKIKLPTFSGDVRLFAKFQRDYEKIVVPAHPDVTQRAYVLKDSCLKDAAKKYVENIDDLEEIWKRLKEKYGDKLELVEIVITELEASPTMKASDDQKFVSFVDLLEKGLQDLEAVGARSEVANMYSIKLLEKKISRTHYLAWLKEEPNLEGTTRFEKLFSFLKGERKRVEKLIQRSGSTPEPAKKDPKDVKNPRGSFGATNNDSSKTKVTKNNCLVHSNVSHFTRRCRAFLAKTAEQRAAVLKAVNGCELCLTVTHVGKPCPFLQNWETCKLDGCEKYHSRLLHEADVQGFLGHIAGAVVNASARSLKKNTILLVQRISTNVGMVCAFFDNGSTLTLISTSFVRRHRLKGIKISYNLHTVGGITTHQTTYLHDITLVDITGKTHIVQALEIEEICGVMKKVDVSGVVTLFQNLQLNDVRRVHGQVELLIGSDHLGVHPKELEEVEGLRLYTSIFGTGRVLCGSHPRLEQSDQVSAHAMATASSTIDNVRVIVEECQDPGIDFFSAEEFGVKVQPSCDDCKRCENCTVNVHDLSRKDQRAKAAMEKNLELDPIRRKWRTPYLYMCDPKVLEENRQQVEKITLKQEDRLIREGKGDQYNEQFDDFVRRGVFRELTREEQEQYTGKAFYVTHHAVFKEGSSSTPMRLVTNSSLKFKGLSFNDILEKGPNTLNSCYGIQLKFRCHPIAIVCDISKMYHQVETTIVERHLRRLLWRHLDTSAEFKCYGIETVNFGDRPAAAIVTIAVRRTAEIYKDVNPTAAQALIDDIYMDDIVTGADDEEKAEALKGGISEILPRGGFKEKGFVMTGDTSEEALKLLGSGEIGRVLGMGWEPGNDVFKVKVRIKITVKLQTGKEEREFGREEIPSIISIKITLRILMSITNSCYDPLGLLVAITVCMKIALRRLFTREKKLAWDEELPDDVKKEWIKILQKVKDAEKVTFKRCIKPVNARGNPDLIISNDGSELAMCATAHIRWECEDGSVKCQLWTAKSRVTPLQRQPVPRSEMSSAVMGTRVGSTLEKVSPWKFDNIYRIVDSECTLATLKKESTALKPYMGNRASECLGSSDVKEWYCVKSEDNIADLATREDAKIEDISEDSPWQNGKEWMYLPKEEWPVKQDVGENQIPPEELIQNKMCAAATNDEPTFSFREYEGKSYQFVIRMMARILRAVKKKSFKGAAHYTVQDLKDAETFALKISMQRTKKLLDQGKLTSLRAEEGDDGIIRLGSRAMEGLEACYESRDFPILAYDDPIAHLWIKSVHNEDHSGITRTVAKSRRKFWVVKARKIAKAVKRSCYTCRLLEKVLAQQQMAPLPRARQVMSPTFQDISVDLIGPVEIRGTVNKRSRKKVWGLVITCLATRAVHLDVTDDYSMESVLTTLRRFIATRGSPRSIFSDKGTQLKAAAKELESWATENKIQWDFAPAEGQHQNGVTESLVKSIKRTLYHVVGNNVMTFSELQTVFLEVATIINARPIGIVTGSDPTQPTSITPNHLLLGRSTPDVVDGDFDYDKNVNKRHVFLKSLVDQWWRKWYDTVLPSLVPSYKWHHRHRCVQPGDVCLIRYANERKANYRLGRVIDVKKSSDGLVRSVKLVYKNANETSFREVDRPIHGIAVIVPIEEQSTLDPKADVFEPDHPQSSPGSVSADSSSAPLQVCEH